MARLRRAKDEEKALIYRWWKGIFAEDDGGITEISYRFLGTGCRNHSSGGFGKLCFSRRNDGRN